MSESNGSALEATTKPWMTDSEIGLLEAALLELGQQHQPLEIRESRAAGECS